MSLAVILPVIQSAFLEPLTKTLVSDVGAKVVETLRMRRPDAKTALKIELPGAAQITTEPLDEEAIDALLRQPFGPSRAAAPRRGAEKPAQKKARPAVEAKDVVLHAGDVVVVSPVFKLVFIALLVLTFVSGASAVALAFGADPHVANQEAMFDSMNTVWKLGVGAILGLLGGKAA